MVELAGGALIGTATLWSIDTHSRSGHVGLSLLPAARGKGYGTDVVATLGHYGFALRNLHRLQIETLADNTAMLRSAERNGFVREGGLCSSAWLLGEFLDEVLLGLLGQDWKQDPAAWGLSGRSVGSQSRRAGEVTRAPQRRVRSRVSLHAAPAVSGRFLTSRSVP
ncbi:GNAT family N-acetyltransferase [Streptomyces microflavus]|uniref:GNAT family N-acetyltransferase n=1 Tax=Streptomyces microflavus TaxID=1919 RepID=UPI00367E68C6